jgi:DHA2 family multidrug resistance protein
MINTLAAISIVGFLLLIAGQFVARRPVIGLDILFNRSFASVFLMSLVVGGALYGLLYLIPQYLANVPGYNPEQSGYIAMISGVPTLMLMPVFPLAVRLIDVRLAVAMGLGFYGISCMLNSHLTPDIAGPELIGPQLLRGVGQFFSMLFLNQAATASAGKDRAEDASCLFNAARNLGGSFGLAVISTLLDQRATLHTDRIGESVTANSPDGQAYLASLTQQLASRNPGGGPMQSLAVFSEQVAHQASVLTYSDLFWLFGWILFGSIPLVLLMKPLPKGGAAKGEAS